MTKKRVVLPVYCPWCGRMFDLKGGQWHITSIHDSTRGKEETYYLVEFRARNTDHRCPNDRLKHEQPQRA